VESVADSITILSVDAADEFNNTILDSPDFVVSIDGESYPLDPPRYEHPLSIPAGTDAAFEIVFMHAGAAFHEPLALVVAPPKKLFNSENVLIVAFASMFGLILVFGLYRCLTKKDGDADVVTEVKEFRKNVVAGGLNAADPITDSVNAFTIAKACSGQAVALIYFVLVAVSSVCATYAVGVNVQQARSLKKDLEGIKLGDDALEQQEADLAKKYPKVLAEGDESLMQKAKAAAAKAGVVQPVSSSAAPEDPAVVKEKAALSKLLLVLKLRLEVFQKKRQKKRVIAAVIQVF
ncbi:hypothetical protein TeGR_g9244, partial [Tetraparma gracilis]